MLKLRLGLFLFLIILAMQVSSADVCNKRELVEDIKYNIDKVDNYEYEEIKELNNLCLSRVSAMSTNEVTGDTCRWVNLILKMSDKYCELSDLTNSNEESQHQKALDLAKDIREDIGKLKEMNVDSIFIQLPELVLQNFYMEEAKFYENLATGEETTEKRLKYLNNSLHCYHKAEDLSNYARIDFEIKKTLNNYKEDMSEARNLFLKARKEYSQSGGNLVHAYLKVRNAKLLSSEALKIYEEHGEQPERVTSFKSSISGDLSGITYKLITKMTLYFVTLFLIMIFIFKRLWKWMDDVADTKLGGELLR